MSTNRARVVEAVNYLITSQRYSRLINEITNIIEHWDTHPMTYGGHLTHLNALIDVGLTNRSAFERLVGLIEKKRKLLPTIKRVDYQKDFMAAKRARQEKSVELLEMQQGKFPNAAARKKYAADQHARWMKLRDEYVDAKGKLSWEERNATRRSFWDMIDAQLDENLTNERKRRVLAN